MSAGPQRVVLGPDRAGVTAVVDGGALRWRGGEPPAELVAGATRLPCADALIQDGCVNAHTHLYSGLVPFGVPLPAPWPNDFVQILERLWWRLDRALDAELLEAAAEVAVAEGLLAGTTGLIDHHESPGFIAGSLDVLAAACARFGVRAVLCYGATERNGGRDEARAGLLECRRFARERARPGVLAAMVGLHASFTVSDETLGEAAALARELGVGVHIHVAEAPADVADARRRGYAGVMARLDAFGLLGRGTVLAHGIHLTADEVALAEARGAWFVQNPRSNRGNGVGYPARLTGASRVALGTDGYPSCMDEEVAAARAEGAAFGEDPGLPERRLAAGRVLLARQLGADLGGDLVAMGPRGALHAVVAGRVVVRDGRFVLPDGGLGPDIETLRRRASAAAGALAERLRAFE